MGNSEMSDANNQEITNVAENDMIVTDLDDNTTQEQEADKGKKRKREGKLRSEAWNHFTRNPQNPNECKCNYCKKPFTCSSKGGTTHLNRHINEGLCTVYKKQVTQQGGKGQTLLSFTKSSSDQCSNTLWKFDQERSRRELTELIITRELPFSFVEDPVFQKYALGLNPRVKFVSRITMRSDCMKLYEVEKNKLKEFFLNSSLRVCLTTDTWTSKQELPFMALTAHFIDKEWKLHKKIINFPLVPVKASGENLSDIVINCLLEWNIDKICTITMDNHSANDVLSRYLQEHYASRGLLLLEGRNLQVRCWGHVLNLIVQEGLDEIKFCIQRIRNAVKYVKASPKRKLEFLQYAEQERISRGKMLVLDVCTRWNSTYLMLGSALHYRKAYDRMKARDLNFKDPPLSEDWERAEIVHSFLEAFYIVTNIFSGSKYCTANVFFREVYRIFMLLRETSKDVNTLLGRMAANMLVKFEKYWVEKEPNILLSIALVLDPRFKLKYLKFCYNKIYESSLLTSTSCTVDVDRVERELYALFNEYSAIYEVSCHQKDVLEKEKVLSNEESGSSISLKKNMEFMEEFYKFSEEEDTMRSKSELDVYLEEKLHQQKFRDDNGFEILEYWKSNVLKFPVLSMMARDILAIPVSSVASESAFSTGGRVLNKFRSSLLPSTVEALVCTQDWIRSSPKETEIEEEFDSAFSGERVK